MTSSDADTNVTALVFWGIRYVAFNALLAYDDDDDDVQDKRALSLVRAFTQPRANGMVSVQHIPPQHTSKVDEETTRNHSPFSCSHPRTD